jgi:hypothetical protein
MQPDLKLLLRMDSERRADKALLTIPIVDQLGKERCQDVVRKQLAECAKVIKAKNLLFRWRKCGAPSVLVIWNKDSHLFTHFDNDLFRHFLGIHFDLVDSRGMSFGLPAAATTAKIWEELLRDEHGLPWASWQLTDEYRRAGK